MQGAGGIGGLLAVIRNGQTYYPVTDANGNITEYIDETGAIVAHREFDAYGNTLVSTGAMVNDFNFWFSTKYLDHETGLYYYGLRYYNPELGRWLSRDPIEEEGGPNVYRFVNNKPLSLYDYLGMWVIKVMNKDGKEISSPEEIIIENVGMAGAGEFHGRNLNFLRDAAAVAEALKDIDAILRGDSKPPPSCVAEIRLRITVGAENKPAKGTKVYYAVHVVRGGMTTGGKGFNASSAEVRAHELGHAKAWFEIVKTDLFDYLRRLDNYGKEGVPFTEQQEDDIRKKFYEIVNSQRYLQASADAANNATIQYYNNNHNYRRLVAPNNLAYFPRIDRGFGGIVDFMDPTHAWEVVGNP